MKETKAKEMKRFFSMTPSQLTVFAQNPLLWHSSENRKDFVLSLSQELHFCLTNCQPKNEFVNMFLLSFVKQRYTLMDVRKEWTRLAPSHTTSNYWKEWDIRKGGWSLEIQKEIEHLPNPWALAFG